MTLDVLIVIVEFAGLAAAGLVTGYLALLSLLALFARTMTGADPERTRRFVVLIPAHNEEGSIGGTLKSLSAMDYPPGKRDIVVVADNCTDETANVARSLGARVLERTDDRNRGKGHALRWAFDALMDEKPGFDAFVVIDADSVVTPNFLHVMNRHLERGATAIQSADLVVENSRSWSTEITRLGFTLYNHVRPLGRKILGFSAGLRGNGMCFDARLFTRVPWNAYGVTEDLQYGLTLVLSGETVQYAPEATVYATMPALARNAVSQRTRWERGRGPVRERFSGRLLRQGFTRPSPAALDAWLDLVTPPFVHLMAVVLFVTAAHALPAIFSPGLVSAFLPPWLAVCAFGITHVLVGLIAARADAGLYRALLYVPLYAGWKVLTYVVSKPPEEWIRTTREERVSPPVASEREEQ